MYWCIDKIFADPAETVLCSIPEVDTMKDDYELYKQVNSAIRRSSGRFLKGWFLNLLSWKRCTEVEFVKVRYLLIHPLLFSLVIQKPQTM